MRDYIFYQRKMEHERAIYPWLYEEDQKEMGVAEEAGREAEAGPSGPVPAEPDPADTVGAETKDRPDLSGSEIAPSPADPLTPETDGGSGGPEFHLRPMGREPGN